MIRHVYFGGGWGANFGGQGKKKKRIAGYLHQGILVSLRRTSPRRTRSEHNNNNNNNNKREFINVAAKETIDHTYNTTKTPLIRTKLDLRRRVTLPAKSAS